MSFITHELPRELEHIEIDIIADAHVGDANHDESIVRRRIKSIADNPNRFAILNGDLANCAILGSKSDIYSETMHPDKQMDTLCDYLNPIKDKILGVTSGNHENRIYKDTGVDITRQICMRLGIEDVYSKEGATLFLNVGELSTKKTGSSKKRQIVYTLYMTHGANGGGKYMGSRANALQSLREVSDADIFVHSHTHTPMVFRCGKTRTDKQNKKERIDEQLFVMSAACCGYGGYAKEKSYAPPSIVTPIIHLDGRKKAFYATL